MRSEYFARRLILLRRKQQGAVAILVGLSITAMVGFAGLVLDLGKLYIVKTELQNTADACALAASQALTGANNQQLAIGEAAGITTGMQHKVLFQKDPVTLTTNSTVEFSANNAGNSFVTKAGLSNKQALAMRYVRCTVNKPNIDTWFIQVLNVLPGVNIGQQNVSASAVATLQASQVTCGLPVAVCQDKLAGKSVGDWLTAVTDSNSNPDPISPADFQWADFTPPNGGAAELGNMLTGDGQCDLPAVGTKIGQPGAKTSLANEWNSYFGIYQGSVKPGDAKPDFSGYAYTENNWSVSTGNAFTDFISKRTANTAYQGDSSTGLNTKGTIEPKSYLAANGGDRRMKTAPVVDCNGFAGSSHVAPIASWACIFMLHPINNSASGSGTKMYLEYRGNANDLNSPCASNGLPGGPGSKGPLVSALVR